VDELVYYGLLGMQLWAESMWGSKVPTGKEEVDTASCWVRGPDGSWISDEIEG